MREWFTPAEIALASGGELPSTERGINRLAGRNGWRQNAAKARKRDERGGGWLYHISLLPGPVQARLRLAHDFRVIDDRESQAQDHLWQKFEALPDKAKAEARRRLEAINRIEALKAGGLSATAAARIAAREAAVSAATLFNWMARTKSVAKSDRLASLAPERPETGNRANCHDQAWSFLKSDFLRPEKPGFSACYRRMVAAAKTNDWSPIPSERALRRRLDVEVPRAVQVLARDGRDKAKALYPAQTRSRAHFHAMQAVNMDGHKIDVFVAIPGQDKPSRIHLLALQDLYSGKIVAWRLSHSENKETVRLVIGDMVERFGIPDRILLDNGRAFASKWISGGTPNRYRFKVRDEDPRGLLTTLGIEIVWALPYSGQSKPIERAFRDLAEEIAKHPFCAGAYTGNKPDAKPENYASRAIPLDVMREHVAARIAEHNARPGRRSEAANGRSFDATFADSIAQPGTVIRVASQAQRTLWLSAAERIRTRKGNGEIHMAGNRYWAKELTGYAGRDVTVRFDPDQLKKPLLVFDAQDRKIAEAQCIEAVGFDSREQATAHAKQRGQYLKTLGEQKRLAAAMSADQLARIAAAAEGPAPSPTPRPEVVRLSHGGKQAAQAAVPAEQPVWDEEMESAFSRGLQLIAGGRD